MVLCNEQIRRGLDLRILKDLGVNITMGIGLRVRGKSKELGWSVDILGLKTKKRQVDCRTPNASVLKINSTLK